MWPQTSNQVGKTNLTGAITVLIKKEIRKHEVCQIF